jgi:hypothetical protein
VAIALGINFWVLGALVPILATRAWPLLPLALPAPIVLAIGLRRRSALALLVVFPTAALLPHLASAELRADRLQPAPAFVLLAAILLAYLPLACARIAPVRPLKVGRTLPATEVPPYWRRRLRVYAGLAVAALVVPLTLVGAADLSLGTSAALGRSHAGHAGDARVALTALCTLAALGLYRAFLAAPLSAHLAQDRDLLDRLEAESLKARRGRPGLAFYVGATTALGAMAALLWLRVAP